MIHSPELMKRLSYFVRAEGPDREAVKKGLDWLAQVTITRGYIAVPGLRNLEGLIGEELGKAAVVDLRSKGKTVILSKEIYVITKLKPLQNAENAPVLAFYPYGKFLDSLDSIRDVMAMLVVPWRTEEIENWVKACDAKELGSKSGKSGPSLDVSRLVDEAMKDFSSRVNRAMGVENPLDRDAAVQLFVVLRDGGESYSPDEIKAWLVSKAGWSAAHAQEVAEVACKVQLGKIPKRGDSVWPKDILQVWKARAGKR